ncbi:MAG: protein tyrosine phosphatase [Pseudolabrys sp.]|nr:protein tyrosine phosphatase [Pseudolabrys sp.]
MIHVCSLARLYATVDETKARHIVTLLRLTDRVTRPVHISEENHLILAVDDIVAAPAEGQTLPGDEHVARLITFAGSWDRKTPLIVHCFAGISRSTAAAFVTACALNPGRDETTIAQAIRNASPTAQPNARIVSIADRLLRRDGRMMRAVEAHGPAQAALEGDPFRLDLE